MPFYYIWLLVFLLINQFYNGHKINEFSIKYKDYYMEK